MQIRDYRDLIVWQKGVELVEVVYRLTKSFPKEEIYGLTSQMRRSAVSIPSNTAEGQGRRSTREFSSFLSIAHGSLKELETQAIIAQRLGYVGVQEMNGLLELTNHVGRLTSRLVASLKKRLP